MSLVQHVTAIEGIDREEPLDIEAGAEPIRRRLSYDAFRPIEDVLLAAAEPTPHAATYQISTARRAGQVAFGVISCCLASGIVFGFASIKPVFVAEGVYRELCLLQDDDAGYDVPCPEQDMRLNLFFITASITTNVSSLAVGAVLDRFGRRLCYYIACVFLSIGLTLLGYAFAIPEFDGYLVGNFFLGLGGAFLFVPSFELVKAFPKYSGLITALVTGAFDASAAVFLFYRMAWEATENRFTPSQFFFAYLTIPVLILLGEWTIMPKNEYFTTVELEQTIVKVQDPACDIHDSDQDLSDNELYRVRSHRAEDRKDRLDQIEVVVGDAEEREERARQEEERLAACGIWGVLHGLPAHRQMLTPWFIFLLLLTVIQMLRMNYFIATIRAQYRYMLGSEELGEVINDFFDVALPMGGVFATPFIGLLLNNLSVVTILSILTGVIAVIGVLNCLPFLWAGYATVCTFVIFRPFFYSAVSDYATKVFGFATFGRIYGMLVFVSGLAQFVQSGLDELTHGPLRDDPTAINVFMAITGTGLGTALTVFAYTKGNAYRDEVRRESLAGERLGLIQEQPELYGTTAE